KNQSQNQSEGKNVSHVLNLRLNLREGLESIVADLVGVDARALSDREQQVRERRLIGILQMLSAFDLAVRASDDRHRLREVIGAIAVAHVAAPDKKRVIEHGAVAVGQRLQLVQELRHHRAVVGLNLDAL